jgi:HAD domain in Swiss Army Knife RNA repair proteins
MLKATISQSRKSLKYWNKSKFVVMLLFLDIDGVMVPAKGWKKPELLSDGFAAFSGKAVSVLQNLISKNTTVVLTSSHKSNYSVDEWKNIFRKRGIYIEKIRLLDKNINNLGRKDEIERWFRLNNTHEDFIIIDDDKSLNSLPEYLKRNLILTSPLVGLTNEHLVQANNIK